MAGVCAVTTRENASSKPNVGGGTRTTETNVPRWNTMERTEKKKSPADCSLCGEPRRWAKVPAKKGQKRIRICERCDESQKEPV
jgi:hypothetical protein